MAANIALCVRKANETRNQELGSKDIPEPVIRALGDGRLVITITVPGICHGELIIERDRWSLLQ